MEARDREKNALRRFAHSVRFPPHAPAHPWQTQKASAPQPMDRLPDTSHHLPWICHRSIGACKHGHPDTTVESPYPQSMRKKFSLMHEANAHGLSINLKRFPCSRIARVPRESHATTFPCRHVSSMSGIPRIPTTFTPRPRTGKQCLLLSLYVCPTSTRVTYAPCRSPAPDMTKMDHGAIGLETRRDRHRVTP